jgi:hypothetical protein
MHGDSNTDPFEGTIGLLNDAENAITVIESLSRSKSGSSVYLIFAQAGLTQQRFSGSEGLMRLRGGAPAKPEDAKPKHTVSSVVAAVTSPKIILVIAVLGA